jgi:hypothetical protein
MSCSFHVSCIEILRCLVDKIGSELAALISSVGGPRFSDYLAFGS